MTPAEELRAAAEKLRALATAASPGPWTAEPVIYGPPCDGWGDPSVWEIHSKGYSVVSHQTHEGGGIDQAGNAEWIAAMHPGVGAALADWLDVAAVNADVLTWPNQFIEHALAVAHAVLGTQPDGSSR